MGQKVNIPSQNQPFRRQASIGGNVSFRNIGDNNDNSFIALAKVTRVYYQRGKLDFKLTNTNSLVADRSGNGSGSAPIPVDFFGRRKNGQVFGHYRPVKIGDLIAVAYVNGHKSSPIVIGVYPNSGQDYEIISPSLYLDGDDEDAGVAETALSEQKIYPSMQLEYRSGSGTIAKALNGHSFLTVDDETSHQYDKLWQNYDTVGFFHNSSDAINPLKETAGDWLLVHEDNPLSDDGDNHRTRFFVNKKGEIQIVLMDNTSAGTISVLEGSKQDGFTISQYYDLQAKKSGDLSDDVYEPDFKSATNYVSLNVGKDQEIALEVAAKNSSKLELKSDGLYLNGKPFVESLNQRLDNLSDNIKKDIHQEVPSNSDFKELADSVSKNAQAARDAAESARQAGESAKDAGLSAEKAGEDAKATGDDIKKRIIYYSSISKEKDVAIPGKYIIINTDTYIANGTIKTAYIEDGAIDHAKIASEAVGSSQIEDAAITRAKIANLAVGSAQIEDLAVTDEKVGKLSFDHMIGATLDAGKINVINLTADNIKAHSLTADNLNVGKLSDITGNAGTISKGRIQAGDDPNSGVVIDNLDADNPNKYTPAKKAFLLSEVKKLNSAAKAAIDYGKKTGVDYSAVEKAQKAMDDGLASLLGDMATTTEFDYNTVIKLEQDLQDAVNAFHSKSNSDIMAQIGTTADGKNAIYRGAEDPVTAGKQPHENDIWLQILSNGTYNIRVWDGAQWINPGLADIKAVSDSLSSLPKSYYQPEEPVGEDVHDGDTWYKLTKGSDSKYTYVTYKRENGQWTQLLDDSGVANQNSIKTLQKGLDDAKKNIQEFQYQNTKKLQDLTFDLSWHKVTGPFDANKYQTTFNVYYYGNQAINTPINSNFYLITYAPDTDQISQVLRSGDGSNSWERVYTADGGWSSWKKTITSNDVNSTINNAITDATNSINASVDNKIKNAQEANNKAISDTTDLINKNKDISDQLFKDVHDQIAQNEQEANQSIKSATDLIKQVQQEADNQFDDVDKTITGLGNQFDKKLSDTATNINGTIQKNQNATNQAISAANQQIQKTQGDVANDHEMILAANAQIKKTQDSVALTSSAIGQANNRIDEVNAQLKISTGHIQSAVEDISSNFNTLSIGGDNLLKNSDNYFDNNTKKDQNIGELTLDRLNTLRGKEVTVSVDTIWNNYTQDNNQNNRLGWEISANYRQGNTTKNLYLGAWKFPSSASGTERVSATFTVPDYEFTWTDGGKAYIQINGSASVSRPQIQLGNKATAWSIGSSDINASIEKNTTLIDQTSKHLDLVAKDLDGKIAAVRITKDEIQNVVNDSNKQIMSIIDEKANQLTLGIADLREDAVIQGTDYGGVIINKNGVMLTSGKTKVNINGNDGFRIQGNNKDVFHVDNQGNLTISGKMTGGDISGVNFSGSNLTLTGSMKVKGQILFANGKGVLSSQGLSLKGGGLSISDNQGNQTTYVDQYGTFTTTKGVFTGDITAHKLILDSSTSSINMGGGVFQVNSKGDVIANSFTSNNVKITGGAFTTGAISSSSISGGTITGATITGNTIVGGTINGNDIVGSSFRSSSYANVDTNYLAFGYGYNYGASEGNYDTRTMTIFNNGGIKFSDIYNTSPSNATRTITQGDKTVETSHITSVLATVNDKTTHRFTSDAGVWNIYPSHGTTAGLSYYYELSTDAGYENTLGYVLFPIMKITRDTVSSSFHSLDIDYTIDMSENDNTPDNNETDIFLVAWDCDKAHNDLYVENLSGQDCITGLERMNVEVARITSEPGYVTAISRHSFPMGYHEFRDILDLSPISDAKNVGVGLVACIVNNKVENVSSYTNPRFTFGIPYYNFKIIPAGSVDDHSRFADNSTQTVRQTTFIGGDGSYIQESEGWGTNDYPMGYLPNEKDSKYLSISHGTIRLNSQGMTKDASTTISGDGIYFGPATDANNNATKPRIMFTGTGGDKSPNVHEEMLGSGMYIDNWGNIHGQEHASTFRWYNSQGEEFFDAPFDRNQPFQFYSGPASGWGPIRMGWVKFDNWSWAGNVPAIYTYDGKNIAGIAMWQYYVIPFSNGRAWNLADWMYNNKVYENTNTTHFYEGSKKS